MSAKDISGICWEIVMMTSWNILNSLIKKAAKRNDYFKTTQRNNNCDLKKYDAVNKDNAKSLQCNVERFWNNRSLSKKSKMLRSNIYIQITLLKGIELCSILTVLKMPNKIRRSKSCLRTEWRIPSMNLIMIMRNTALSVFLCDGYAVGQLDIAGFGQSGRGKDGFIPDSDCAH